MNNTTQRLTRGVSSRNIIKAASNENNYGPDTDKLLEIFKRYPQPVSLTISNLNIHSLPPLPDGLERLYCSDNKLTSLPELPDGLRLLDCGYNEITVLPPLPSTLQYLKCDHTPLTSLPPLPSTLEFLSCGYNKLTSLPPLPSTLQYLSCFNTPLTSLPPLPEGLDQLLIFNTQITVLPELPSTLQYLDCHNNPNLTTITGRCPLEYSDKQASVVFLYCPNLQTQPEYGETCESFFTRFSQGRRGPSNGMNSQPIIGGKRKTHRNKQTRRRKVQNKKSRKQKRSYK